MTDSKVTEAMVEAYRLAKVEADEWCGCIDRDENRHYIVNGNEILWETISEDYAAGHSAMIAEVRRLRDVHALSAALVQAPVQVGEIAIKPLEWECKHTPYRSYPKWQAETIVGQYVVVDTARSVDWILIGTTIVNQAVSVEDAKAAAQADYEQRIRSSLALPLPVQEPEPVAYLITTIRTGETRISTRPVANLPYNRDRFISQPLYLHPETASVREGWRPIETAPKGEDFLAYGQYFYPGGQHPTTYMMIAEVNENSEDWPHISAEGLHCKGFFSHWMPLPVSPTDAQTVKGVEE
jgi:hypothetical protein